MSIAAPRGHRPPRAYTTTLITASAIGAILLGWYALVHATPGKLLFTGIILIGMGIATAILARRQCCILDRLDRVDRQFAHVRMRYVAEEIDTE